MIKFKNYCWGLAILAVITLAFGFTTPSKEKEPKAKTEITAKLYNGLTGQEVANKYGKVFYDKAIKTAFVPVISKTEMSVERMKKLAVELVDDCCPGTSDCSPSSPACGCSTVDQEWIPDGLCCRCYWSSPDNKCYTYLTSSC